MVDATRAIATAVDVQLARMNQPRRWLADSAGFSASALSKRLSGTTPLDIDDVDSIARALGLADAFALFDLARIEIIQAV